MQGSQGVWVCVHCTRTAHVPPDMLMRQCTHTIRCAHIGVRVRACIHMHTHSHTQNAEACMSTSKQTCMVMRSTQIHSTSG